MVPSIVVVDYHKGNLSSVVRGLSRAGARAQASDSPEDIRAADAVVLMHHQIAGGQVGVGLQSLLIAVPLGAGLFGLACQRRGQLTLRQHRQL